MLCMTFEPDHRLVADTLEADWNHKLRAFEQAQREYQQQRQQDRVAIDEELRTRLIYDRNTRLSQHPHGCQAMRA